MELFECNVLEGLKLSGISVDKNLSLVAAVSGGADSVSMLVALDALSKEFGFSLKCITVNHNIRPEQETFSDAEYVRLLCSKMNIPFEYFEVERGRVTELSVRKKIGIEAAARELRYGFFDSVLKDKKYAGSYICLAHNQNDFLETLLMRFMQGADVNSLSGIRRINGFYLRPLLSVTRDEIELYLEQKKISYVTDSTNYDNAMLRNRIRNVLVPVLNENFPGWQKGALLTGENLFYENKILQAAVENAFEQSSFKILDGKVFIKLSFLENCDYGIFRRLILEAVKNTGASDRITSAFIHNLYSAVKEHKNIFMQASGLSFFSKEEYLIACKAETLSGDVATESCFFVTIEEPCSFKIGDRNISVLKEQNGIYMECGDKNIFIPNLDFPFVVRSRAPGDTICSADLSYKSVLKILEDWKCRELKDYIPLVERIISVNGFNNGIQDIVCIWGSLYDFKDWIVK